MKKVTITQDAEEFVEQRVLAKVIIDIGDSMRRLLSSGLNRRAIIALIHDQSKIGKREIEIVLNNLEAMKADYTS